MPDLIIFDCDGVLVDSELIFGRVLGECLIAAEFPITMDEAMVFGLGKNRITLTAAVEARFGRLLPEGFFETMRARVDKAFERELAPLGIRVNSISPGPIDTPIHATWADDLAEAYRWLGSQVPLGRIGAPEEVALWITLLLSPLASFMTGAVIPLDGGQVIDRE